MERVDSWAEDKQMKLNILKTKNIIFNFSSDKKFSTKGSIQKKKKNVKNVFQAI